MKLRLTVVLASAACLLSAFLIALSADGFGTAVAGPHTSKGTQPGVSYPISASYECAYCHGYDYDPDGFTEPGDTWSGTVMAQAARDPLFWAALDQANHDVPQIGDFCLRCHAPGPWLAGRSEPPGGTTDGCGFVGPIDDPYAGDFDGVTCHLCHRMMVNETPPPSQQPFYVENAQFWIDDTDCGGQGEPCRRGPYDYQGTGEVPAPHPHQYSPYHEGSAICGTCHNVTSPVLNLIVNGVDQGIRFPIERTHREWQQSEYAQPGPAAKTCQSCHMPDVNQDPVYACAFQDNNRTANMGLHAFVGGNAWIPEVIRQEYPGLAIDTELAMIRDAAVDMLKTRSASLEITVPAQATPGSPLGVEVKVTNLAGHKLPTGYAEGRRLWLHVTAHDGSNSLIWESGAYDAATGILTSDPGVKIYRAEQGIWNRNGTSTCDAADTLGQPIFHFALNNCVAVDNRIPPLGFGGGGDIETRPVGYAYPETSPGSGVLVNHDVTAYAIPIPASAASPITVRAELEYQTTSKEYVEFLRDEAIANGFPDDCIERTSGPANKSRGALLHEMWTTNGRAAPVVMAHDTGTATIAATPGEASRSVDMRVTSYDGMTGEVAVSYQPACGSTDHTVYVGPLSAVSSMTFTGQFCARGTSGSTSFSSGAGNRFWVIVGNDGAKEGSYGRDSQDVERPENTTLPSCNIPQDLSRACVP